MFASAFLALAVLPLAFAQHVVTVGANNALTFTPNELTAAPGDTVTFMFVSKNHTSTTTTFDSPCPPPAGGTADGWDSGFQAVLGGNSPALNFTITVQDTNPRAVGCRQANHCATGMVFVLNPSDTENIQTLMQNA